MEEAPASQPSTEEKKKKNGEGKHHLNRRNDQKNYTQSSEATLHVDTTNPYITIRYSNHHGGP